MSRPKKDKKIVQDSITEEAMIAYLNNELTAEDKHQFEKLMADDPFAQEALEGLQAAPNKNAVAESISNINRRVRQETGLKETRTIQIHWSNYAWAAAVVGLLVGVSFLMINYIGKKEDTLAQNENEQVQLTQKDEPAKTVETIAPVTDSLSLAKDTTILLPAPGETLPNVTEKQNERKENGAFIASRGKDTVQYKIAPAPSAQMNSTLTTSGDNKAGYKSQPNAKVSPDADKGADGATTKTETKPIGGKKEDKKVSFEGGSGGLVKSKEESGPTVTVEDAKKNFDSQNYKEASEQYDQILKKDPSNKDALYFGGISDYINGKSTKAEKNFDKLLKEGNSYTEGSKWYKALIAIQKGKKEEAKKLLNELSNTNGSYKARAVQKLAEIDF